jgi:hypothetical protein
MTPQVSCYCSVINGKPYMCPSCVEALHATISRIRDEKEGVEIELSQARTALNKINALAVAIQNDSSIKMDARTTKRVLTIDAWSRWTKSPDLAPADTEDGS